MMALVEILRRPIAKMTVAEVETGIANARSALVAAEADVVASEKSWRESLIDADDSVSLSAREKLRKAEVSRDRGQALIGELGKRLEAVLARDEQTERTAAYAAAKTLGDAAATRLRKEYQRAAQTVVDIIADLARADLVVNAVNAALPTGAERLVSPESQVRDTQATAAKITKEKIVTRYVFEDTGVVLSETDARKVIKAGGQAYVPREQHPEMPITGKLPIVVERTFREIVEELPPPIRDIPRLASAVCLPSLVDVTELWSPLQPTWQGLAPEDVLAHGDELAAARKTEEAQSIARRFRTRLEPVDEAEVDTIREARRA